MPIKMQAISFDSIFERISFDQTLQDCTLQGAAINIAEQEIVPCSIADLQLFFQFHA